MFIFWVNCFICVGSNRASDLTIQEDNQQSIQNNTPQRTGYIPQAYDITPTLVAESRCCFFTSRWILQPINVISPLIATGLVAVGEYYINSNPSTARLLNGIGLGFSLLDFISGVLLLKVDNKLEGIDKAIHQRRNSME